jgi:tetratricopeptide (TPR) repeat protein
VKHVRGSIVLFFALIATQTAFSQNAPNQNWLLFEQGNAASARKEFGLALQLYEEAVLKAGTFPEAEIAIGDIYLEEGEVDLALAQYEKAYKLRNAFYIPNMQYSTLYKIAHLYETQGLYKQMEDRLLQIVQDDKRFQETSTSKLRTQIERNFYDKGLDRVLVLYKYEDSFSAAAHSQLGWFYYRTGRYSQAVSHLLYSTIYRMSSIDSYLAERDVDYQYTTLLDLFAAIGKSQDLIRYANESQLFRDLYYLASSAFVTGYPEKASSIWKSLAASPMAASYQALSQKQLKSPFTEPLLKGTR